MGKLPVHIQRQRHAVTTAPCTASFPLQIEIASTKTIYIKNYVNL